jgi:hypothetical protein
MTKLLAGWLSDCGSIPNSSTDPFLLDSIQIGSLAHPASYPMANGANFPGSKTGGAWS